MERTITQAFLEARSRPVTQVAFRYSNGAEWRDISWPAYYEMSEAIAAGLASLGVKRGDRIVILSHTRYQWSVADIAALGMGCVTVPIYQSSTVEDATFIINNSQAIAAFVEDEGQLEKVKAIQQNAPSLKHICSFTQVASPTAILWDDLMTKGKAFLRSNPKFFEDESKRTQLGDVATIVYTSGTTGQPKGVVLLHSCIASEIEDLIKLLEITEFDSTLTFLPFAHIFGRVEHWANVYIGFKMCFAESIDRIPANLIQVKPRFMMAVPRIFEKIYSRILSQVDEGSPLKKKIFNWAVKTGTQVSSHREKGEVVPLPLLLQYQVAYNLVFSKIKERLGGNIRFLVSGGAPLAAEIARFFHAAGILILEGYGLTETTAAVTVNRPQNYRFGTVGSAIGDVKLKIADDGEILVKSVKVFKEYYLNPEATSEALEDGWFHTGDIGEIDAKGNVRITDRKKDLIKTAGGKMIAPQKIENLLKTNKFISQVVVYGDKMKYLVALVTLNSDEIKKFAEARNINSKPVQDLVREPLVHDLVRDIIKEKNDILASYETIKNFAILPNDFTVENGELTPSLKVKRKYLSQKYEPVIRSLYQAQ